MKFISEMWHPNSLWWNFLIRPPEFFSTETISIPSQSTKLEKCASLSWYAVFRPVFRLYQYLFFQHAPGEDQWGYEDASERWLPIHTVETIVR